MACETFLKIAQRCRFKFVKQQQDEPAPHVQPMLRELPQVQEMGPFGLEKYENLIDDCLDN